ncbi:hypothetical protein [Cardiobacterium hominis]|jgi:hypothetical protein|uniref:hypothetical protein n=1 Tax=Cardiobacterium hominis TaxID=2718 RepID=UPI0028D360C2|nr:hypothetical protein [Cardiobacterium hominis]
MLDKLCYFLKKIFFLHGMTSADRWFAYSLPIVVLITANIMEPSIKYKNKDLIEIEGPFKLRVVNSGGKYKHIDVEIHSNNGIIYVSGCTGLIDTICAGSKYYLDKEYSLGFIRYEKNGRKVFGILKHLYKNGEMVVTNNQIDSYFRARTLEESILFVINFFAVWYGLLFMFNILTNLFKFLKRR